MWDYRITVEDLSITTGTLFCNKTEAEVSDGIGVFQLYRYVFPNACTLFEDSQVDVELVTGTNVSDLHQEVLFGISAEVCKTCPLSTSNKHGCMVSIFTSLARQHLESLVDVTAVQDARYSSVVLTSYRIDKDGTQEKTDGCASCFFTGNCLQIAGHDIPGTQAIDTCIQDTNQEVTTYKL